MLPTDRQTDRQTHNIIDRLIITNTVRVTNQLISKFSRDVMYTMHDFKILSNITYT